MPPSFATRSNTTSSPPRPTRQRGVGKVRRTTQQDTDGTRRSSPRASGLRIASRVGEARPQIDRSSRQPTCGCVAISTVASAPLHGTGLALHAEQPRWCLLSNEGRVAMTIRQKSALGAAAFAGLVLACSERPDPVAPMRADALASPATHATTYSGRATVVQATLLGLPTMTVVDAGPLPSSGGAEHASLVNGSVPGLLTVEVLHASTVGQGNASRSEASVAELSLTVAGATVSAGLLQARAAAVCGDGGATASGTSDITALSVNGQTVTISGAPNQKVPLPLGEMIINEQTSTGPGDITVNALHVIGPGGVDVIVSSAHADITCQPAPAPPSPGCTGADFATGGGWITP